LGQISFSDDDILLRGFIQREVTNECKIRVIAELSVQTLPDERTSYIPQGQKQFEFCAKSELSVHMANYIYTREFNSLEPDRPQHDHRHACVIAQ
jgi:hypothetical protein